MTQNSNSLDLILQFGSAHSNMKIGLVLQLGQEKEGSIRLPVFCLLVFCTVLLLIPFYLLLASLT